MPSLPANASLVIHAAGLITIFSIYGLCQEAILTRTYGPNSEHFTSSPLLILANRVFSIVAGLGLVFVTSLLRNDCGSFGQRVRPASPWTSYALVAVFNFLSTTCQYEALKYVSYTTSALAKCSKMVPVLIISAGLFKRKHQQKDWIAAGVIVTGCATYLMSVPGPTTHASAETRTLLEGGIGGILLCGYLAFDGLTSTFQERMFGKNENSSDPFGPKSPVLSQMIWTNVWSSAIALAVSFASQAATGSVLPNLELALSSPALGWDILLLSAASTFGVIILLNTIASFGALQASLIMSIRQFVSIVCNAAVFDTSASVGLEGWCGVGWVGAGVWIKMFGPRDVQGEVVRFDQEKEYSVLESSGIDSPPLSPTLHAARSAPAPRSARAYLSPIFLPILVTAVMGMFSIADSPPTVLDPAQFSGGAWDKYLFESIKPTCAAELDAVPYDAKLTTGFVSYPRSGNSFVRSLIERTSNFQTSSIYCDGSLLQTFKGECDHEAKFFVKDHAAPTGDMWWADADHIRHYDQVVLLVRNPLDAILSYWHLSREIEAQHALDAVDPSHEHLYDHGRKMKDTPVGTGPTAEAERQSILEGADYWTSHAVYWGQAPIRTHSVRYEDVTAQPVTHALAMLSFILPAEDLPSIDRVVCVAQGNEKAEAYHSAKVQPFASWDKYEPSLRWEVLERVREPFCKHGYDHLLREMKGELEEMKDFCKGVITFPGH